MEHSWFFSWYGMVFVAFLILGIGLYAILAYRNIIKILLGIEILSKGIGLLLVAAGSAIGKVDTAQTLLVSYIVIEVVVATVVLSLIIHVYHQYGTLDVRKLHRLQG